MKDGKKTRGSITCRKTEQTRLIRCLLYGFVDYFQEKNEIIRVLTSDQELEVRTASYEPEINQTQRAKLVSHMIISSY